ncbi:UNVERIFIED_CONTAM: hypothetical protein FKN15_067582 [Acipenser sinensis]
MAGSECDERKVQPWDPEEVQALVSLWTDRSVQKYPESCVRNESFMPEFDDLKQIGINSSFKQCYEKARKLKQEYKKLKDHK